MLLLKIQYVLCLYTRKIYIAGVPAVLKFLKFQSCPEIVMKFQRVLKFWSVCENVLNFALAVTLHYIKTFRVRSLLYEHKRITMDIK